MTSEEDSKTYQELIKLLLNHCGETGKNEGAVDTLKRKLEESKNWVKYVKYNDRSDESMTKMYMECIDEHNIVDRLKEEIEKLETKRKTAFYPSKRRGVLYKRIKYLKRIMNGWEWTDKHTQIAKESTERFKTHTEDEEVDI